MDETKDPKDTSQTGDTSEGTKGTSEKEPETFTVEETTKKAVSDALSAAGRTAKVLEVREQAVTAKEERAEQKQKEQDERDRYEARDNPEALSALDERQKHRDTKAKLTQVKSELEEEKTKGKQRDAETAETKIVTAAWEIAQKHGVDVEILKKNISKYTDGSTEAMEAIAQGMAKKGGTTPLKVDSSKTIGGGANWEQVRAAFIKNPSNPAIREHYMQAKKERDAQK